MRICLLTLGATLLLACDEDETPRGVFERDVVPVLEARCAAASCHGVLPDADARGETIDWSLFFLRTDADGRLTDLDSAYDASARIIDCIDPGFSPLLRIPLPADFGGQPHAGGDSFRAPDDPAYQSILRWIESEPTGGKDPAPLDEHERLFAERVQPALLSASCVNANCHGLTAAVPYRLDPGTGGRVGRAATRHNYEASVTMLALDGDPSQSRLLRKSLPLHAGGIVHRGGNSAFLEGPEDARSQAIEDWACAEREVRLGGPCEVGPAAMVFVRGPLAPAHPFELDTYVPGTDLFFAELDDLEVTSQRNLTAHLHDGPADVRDPAVDADGERVAFAMRTSAERGHDLYVLTLADGSVKRVTEDAGPLSSGGMRTHRDPTFGPEGHLWFVSTTGVVADSGDRLDAELYELNLETGERVRRTWTPHSERKPVFFVYGEENGGEISFSAVRELMPGKARGHIFRFPPDLSTEYHQHFGITPTEDLFYDMRELPDGRYISLVGGLDGVWRAGRLGVIDRNLGPELNERAAWPEPGLPGYAPPLVRLDPDAAASGATRGLYRDPAPLPDGRVLVAYAPESVSLDDPEAEFDLRIEVLTLAEAPDGTGPRIVDRRVLLDAPGVQDRDPEIILRRQSARVSGRQKWDPEATTGLLVHNGVQMVDAVLANLPPSGPKTPRDDVVGVRLVEALPMTPAERSPTGAVGTTTSLGPQGPQRILAEVPLASDGTFHAELPAGVAFRVQATNAEGIAVGALHDRWFYVAPGQTVKMGVPVEHYDERCAACHGTRGGDPARAFPQTDGITGASLTVSRNEGRDPRRPIPPLQIGDSTRITVDFRDDVQPVLDLRCGECHATDPPAGDLDLSGDATDTFNRAYESLLGAGLTDADNASARDSRLTEFLTSRHAAGLTDAERLTLVRWMDLGSSFRGRPSR